LHSTKSISISTRFALRPNVIEGIVEAIKEEGGEPDISVSCTENLSLKPSNSKELFGIPNLGELKITALEISSYAPHGRVTVKFDTLGYAAPISIQLSGEADEVIRLSAKLEGLVSQARDGWWPKAAGPFLAERAFTLVMASVFASLIAGWLAYRLGLMEHSLGRYFAGYILLWAVIGSALATLVWLLTEKIYVRGVFLIGAGVQEHESLKFRRQMLSIWTLVGALISAAVIGFIGHWFHL
jgi:hypothetical protein